MRTVIDTAQKMTTLMSKLSLKSFKPMPGAMPESIDMSSLIDEAVVPIRGVENVRLSVSGEPVPPVMAVREHIHQVLLNVVLNAKQAIGEKGDISIAIKQSNGSVVVTVDDTGSGIPSSMLESLFRPSQSSRPGGLGVGLYQCKQIMEAHQGTIQLRSEEGKGTQVRIELPIYRPPATI
jgi:signal transduction histidine kinase